MNTKLVVAVAIVTVIGSGVLAARPAPPAQQVPTPAAEGRQKDALPQTPLKVTVVISRYQGEKRTSNLPLHVLRERASGRRQHQSPYGIPGAHTDEP